MARTTRSGVAGSAASGLGGLSVQDTTITTLTSGENITLNAPGTGVTISTTPLVASNTTGAITGLTATLATGTAIVTITGVGQTTNGLLVGQSLTVTAGTGLFGVGATISSIDSLTQFTMSANHNTSGAVTFSQTAAPGLGVVGGVGIAQDLFAGGTLTVLGGFSAPIGISPAVSSTGAFTSLQSTGLQLVTSSVDAVAVKTNATLTVNHDFNESNIWYHYNITSDFTLNLINVPTTNDRVLAVSVVLVQGATGRAVTGFQIDGVAQTLRYPGYIAISGTASRTEVQTFVLQRSSNAWTVRTYMSTYGEAIGSSPLNPASSADAIKTANASATSGLYWIKGSTWTYPALCYCEMTLHGGGWVYLMQRLCTNDQGLPSTYLTAPAAGLPNHASSDFYGTRDLLNNSLTVQAMWNGIVGAAGSGKIFAREMQIVGGTYDEAQRYVSSVDAGAIDWTAFQRFFAGNFVNGTFTSTNLSVWYNNGNNVALNKRGFSYSAPYLATINSGATNDTDLWFCNGADGDSATGANWSFALQKGGAAPPATATTANGGNRHSGRSRWAIIAIKA